MNNPLYENIKKRRQELNMSQDKLASLTGYSNRSAITRIENGDIDLPQSKILLFASALRTTPAHLMGWDTEDMELTQEEADVIREMRKNPRSHEHLVMYAKMIREMNGGDSDGSSKV